MIKLTITKNWEEERFNKNKISNFQDETCITANQTVRDT